MEINSVKYISELLYHHDCVIIPGFGGFIGNYAPAVINPMHHTFHPPFKSLLFNIHLRQNDGLLAVRISQGEKISYQEAIEHIANMVRSWNEVIEKGEELVIDKVGKITREAENILQFEQDFSTNYLPDAFGLTPFVSPAIRRPGLQDKIEKKIGRYIAEPGGKHRMVPKALKWAAILTIPVGIAAYLSIMNIDQIRNFRENYSGIFSARTEHGKGKEINSNLTKSYSSYRSGNDQQTYAAENKMPAKGSAVITIYIPSPPVRPAIASKDQPYAIIVGAFRFRENADNLVLKLKEEGYDASVHDVTTSGLFRVCLGAYDNKEEALKILASVRTKDYSSAWLLKK